MNEGNNPKKSKTKKRLLRGFSVVAGVVILFFGIASTIPATTSQSELPAPVRSLKPLGNENTKANAIPDAKAVAANYYRGDGKGCNIYLTLKENGKFTADWRGCLGKYGEASGEWSIRANRITFKPAKEEGKLKGELKTLDVVESNGQWVLVPTGYGFFYKWVVSRYSCFQKQDRK